MATSLLQHIRERCAFIGTVERAVDDQLANRHPIEATMDKSRMGSRVNGDKQDTTKTRTLTKFVEKVALWCDGPVASVVYASRRVIDLT